MSAEPVVFVTEEFPTPSRGGGALRDLAILNLLTERAPVELICFATSSSTAAVPRRVTVTAVARDRPPLFSRLLAPFRPYVANGYSPKMAEALGRKAGRGRVVWLSRLAMAKYASTAQALGMTVVLDEHNVESALLRALAPATQSPLHSRWLASRCSLFESMACRQAEVVVATSENDRALLAKLAPEARVIVLPNCIDAQELAALRSRVGATLLFTGTLDYYPNIEGLRWFAREIFPKLRLALGQVKPRIVIAGARPTAEIKALCTDNGFELKADPDSVYPLFAEAAALFVPLLSGSGTRIKIIEAMAAGRAVVATPKAVEGLTVETDADVLIAADAAAFARELGRALLDVGLQRRLGERAAATAETCYDWRRQRDVVAAVLDQAGRPRAVVS